MLFFSSFWIGLANLLCCMYLILLCVPLFFPLPLTRPDLAALSRYPSFLVVSSRELTFCTPAVSWSVSDALTEKLCEGGKSRRHGGLERESQRQRSTQLSTALPSQSGPLCRRRYTLQRAHPAAGRQKKQARGLLQGCQCGVMA